MFKMNGTAKDSNKAEITGRKILDGALNLFRTKGFEEATMRDIAAVAGVAIGAAYYYYPSKDAIVLAFYQRSCIEMQPQIEEAVAKSTGNLEDRLKALIHVKLSTLRPIVAFFVHCSRMEPIRHIPCLRSPRTTNQSAQWI